MLSATLLHPEASCARQIALSEFATKVRPDMKPKNIRSALQYTLAAVVAVLSLVGSVQARSHYKILHEFRDHPAMNSNAALVADSVGNLYGTTLNSNSDQCGGSGCGVVFKLMRGTGSQWRYSVVHVFAGPPADGGQPWGGLTLDALGNLYGTTSGGGTYGKGTVFEISPQGKKWKERVLYSFGSTVGDLADPVAEVILDSEGNLFGTALFGGKGSDGWGGVFELKRSGNGWRERVLHRFNGGSDGGLPYGDLILDSAGNLYSTTWQGGKYGAGTVFELSPSSGGSWTEAVLHDFTGSDGSNPVSGVTFDAAGNLYGTAADGGNGNGIAFELAPSMGGWVFSVLHTFDRSDGSGPVAGLKFDSGGNLYGTTRYGGNGDLGVAFRLSRSGNNWTETVLHSFKGKDGAKPNGEVFVDRQGFLYGTTSEGAVGYRVHGGVGYGVVFRITQ
jgi:uncharacterized repeat protein (TIGR03803 family)